MILEDIRYRIRQEVSVDIPWIASGTERFLSRTRHLITSAPRVIFEAADAVIKHPGRTAATLITLGAAACAPSPGINPARAATAERPRATPTRTLLKEEAVPTSWIYTPKECPPKQDERVTGLTINWNPFDDNLQTGDDVVTFVFHLNRKTNMLEIKRYFTDDPNQQINGQSSISMTDGRLIVVPRLIHQYHDEKLNRTLTRIEEGVYFFILCPDGKYHFDISNIDFIGNVKNP